jgi:UDP-glucose 4-epimerase
MVVVLGAGLLGSAVYKKLRDAGIAASIFSKTPCSGLPELICNDISRIGDSGVLDKADTVFYTIHTTVPSSAHNNEYYDVESNVLPFVRFLETARKNSVKRIIYVSTGGAIYGQPAHGRSFSEQSPVNPTSAYGTSKLAIENMLLLQKNNFRDGVTILRPSNIYGPRQRTDRAQGVIAHLLEAARTGKKFERWGDGNSKKDYLYIADFADAVLHLVQQQSPPGQPVYNISSGYLYSVNEIIRAVEAVTGKKIRLEEVPRKDFDISSFSLDSSLFSKTFGWKARYDLETGLAHLLAQ